MEWHVIETAPRDGRDLLLGYRSGCRWIVVAAHWTYWRSGPDNRQSEHGSWYVVKGGGEYVWCATHWMPIPPKPKVA